MAGRDPELTPQMLLGGYAAGIFPMAEGRDDPGLFWVEPNWRGVFPLGGMRLSRSLRRTLRQSRLIPSFDTAFGEVLDGCAARETTWISGRIRDLYTGLHRDGHAHSVEVRRDGRLAGGVYGVALGGAFFGESMFSAERDASKVALAWLQYRLIADGFVLFDTQFQTPHLASLGVEEISRETFRRRLAAALRRSARFRARAALPAPDVVIATVTGG